MEWRGFEGTSLVNVAGCKKGDCVLVVRCEIGKGLDHGSQNNITASYGRTNVERTVSPDQICLEVEQALVRTCNAGLNTKI